VRVRLTEAIVMTESEVLQFARSMIEANGIDALAIARRTARQQERLGMVERVDWWQRIIAALEPPGAALEPCGTSSARIRESPASSEV
jgi:hypothetical protein